MADATVTDALRQQAIDGIKKVTGDDGSTEMHSAGDQIKLAGFAASEAAATGRKLGIRTFKVRPGNALGQ